MPKYYSEETVYKKVGTSDFSNLTRKQLETFVSILHKMHPTTAVALMERFSDFRMTANHMVGILRMKVLKHPKRKGEDQCRMQMNCEGILKELDQKLSQQSITETDKLFIENRLILLACLLKADTKARREKALRILEYVGVGAILILGALLLLTALVSDTDSPKSESGPEGGNDGESNPDYDDDQGSQPDEADSSMQTTLESKPKYQVQMFYPDGTTELIEEQYETEAEAVEHGEYLVGCCSYGAEILNASNPFDNPDSDYEAEFTVIKVDG